mgnify:CR=1 FL=1
MKELTKEEIIKELKRLNVLSVENGDELEDASWVYEKGVLISRNVSEYIIATIEARDAEISEIKKQAREFAKYIVAGEPSAHFGQGEVYYYCSICDTEPTEQKENIIHSENCIIFKSQQYLNTKGGE